MLTHSSTLSVNSLFTRFSQAMDIFCSVWPYLPCLLSSLSSLFSSHGLSVVVWLGTRAARWLAEKGVGEYIKATAQRQTSFEHLNFSHLFPPPAHLMLVVTEQVSPVPGHKRVTLVCLSHGITVGLFI